MYPPNFDKFLCFKSIRNQTFNLDTFLQQTQKHKHKIKTKFGRSSDLQQQNLITEPITESLFGFTEPL